MLTLSQQFDSSVLGLDEKKATLQPPKASQTPSASIATPYAQLPNGSTPGGNISSASVSPALIDSKPQRASRKKRRKYVESAFEGYGEGYDDEEGGDYGEDAGKKKRKRKKVSLQPISGCARWYSNVLCAHSLRWESPRLTMRTLAMVLMADRTFTISRTIPCRLE